jgi:hypothetical protein
MGEKKTLSPPLWDQVPITGKSVANVFRMLGKCAVVKIFWPNASFGNEALDKLNAHLHRRFFLIVFFFVCFAVGMHNVLTLFCALVTENKVLFFSSSYSLLTSASLGLLSILYPLKFRYVYTGTVINRRDFKLRVFRETSNVRLLICRSRLTFMEWCIKLNFSLVCLQELNNKIKRDKITPKLERNPYILTMEMCLNYWNYRIVDINMPNISL